MRAEEKMRAPKRVPANDCNRFGFAINHLGFYGVLKFADSTTHTSIPMS